MIASEELYSSTDACRVSGASYRQLDYWIRQEALEPLQRASGSGFGRRWSVIDIQIATILMAYCSLANQNVRIARVIAAELYSNPELIRRYGHLLIVYTDDEGHTKAVIREESQMQITKSAWIYALRPIEIEEAKPA